MSGCRARPGPYAVAGGNMWLIEARATCPIGPLLYSASRGPMSQLHLSRYSVSIRSTPYFADNDNSDKTPFCLEYDERLNNTKANSFFFFQVPHPLSIHKPMEIGFSNGYLLRTILRSVCTYHLRFLHFSNDKGNISPIYQAHQIAGFYTNETRSHSLSLILSTLRDER
jgi:hypothetical protein